MDGHLAYVGMTRHREGVEVYAGRDDFKGDEELKAKFSRARPNDSTLDYAQRRGMEAPRTQKAEHERPAQRPERERKESGREQKPEAGQGDPVARFKRRKRNSFRSSASPISILHAAELRQEMKQASQEIAHDPARMRAAEREDFAPQVKNFVRQSEPERGREKGKATEKKRRTGTLALR
jgi:hypothetical protein